MGKLKRSSIVKKNKKNSNKTKLTIEELLDHAEQFIDQCDLEKAFQYVKRALDLDPNHTQALETMASVQMEMGNVDSAKKIPNEGFSKYMCLAQLSCGSEAAELYKKGIELMIVEYNKQDNNTTTNQKASTSKSTNAVATTSAASNIQEDDEQEPNKITKLDISTAYGSLAEIYLTDLCMEENADVVCKSYLDKSIEYEAQNPETLQLLASYWISKENNEEAKKSILESLNIWQPKYVEACESGPLVDPAQAITLSYDSRINTTRILTELGELDKAITVLEQLIEEDDEVVVIWYMLGWVNYCKGEDYYSNAKYYLKKANELATKIKYEQRYLDDELRNHVKELLEKLSTIPSDDEDEEKNKENLNNQNNDDNEEDYDTLSEEEADEDADGNGENNDNDDDNENNVEDENNNNSSSTSKKNGKDLFSSTNSNKTNGGENLISKKNFKNKTNNKSQKNENAAVEEPMELT